MTKKTKIIVSITAAIVFIALLWFIFKPASNAGIVLNTVNIEKKDISTFVTATGTVEPITVVEVGTQVSGIISKIYADYNSEVKKGQIIAELDKTTLQSDLLSKEMDLQSSKTEYEYQKINFNRAKELYNQALISKTDYETAKYNFDKSEATYKKNQADLIKVQTNLGFATIYSPIDGIVLSRAVEEGQTVAASFSTPTLFSIANDLTKMQVVANVDEADIGDVKEGQRVSFTVDAYPNDVFNGTVSQVRLEATVTSNVVTYEVIINAPNESLKLKPGLTANVTIYTLEKNDIDALANRVFTYSPDVETLTKYEYIIEERPAQNINEGENLVWILTDKNLSPKIIKIGETDGINTEVLGGLSPTDKVIQQAEVVSNVKKAVSNGATEQSPFMPQRPGSR